MRLAAALALLSLAATSALAQSPPLTGKAPDNDTSAGRTTGSAADARRPETGRAPGARNEPNGQVAPPAAINSGVQVIAPERK